jgi:hypothetical protein
LLGRFGVPIRDVLADDLLKDCRVHVGLLTVLGPLTA